MANEPKIFPLGDNALTVDFGNELSRDLNDRSIALAQDINAHPFVGLIEAVPAMSSVAIFYDLGRVRRSSAEHMTAFDSVRTHVANALTADLGDSIRERRMIEIPVDFNRDAALDIDAITAHVGLPFEQVIDIFLRETYRVYMLGFLPGFAYLGEVDERIAIPRRETPRLKVPKGSVGIAGRQTGIYPLESPGGWQIIGRTSIEMFTPDGESPCRLKAGDDVRFIRA